MNKNADAGTDELEELDDAATPKTGEENDDALDEQAGDSDTERGEKAGEAGEDAGEETDDAGEEEGEGEEVEDEQPDETQLLKEQNQKLTERLDQIEKAQNQPKSQQPAALTDEQWKQHEAAAGVPRETIQYFSQMMGNVISEMKNFFESQVADMKQGGVIDEFTKNPAFKDAGSYRAKMNEFLADFDVRSRSNPKLLEKAYWYARGQGAQKQIKRVTNTREMNRKINTKMRPTVSSGKKAFRGKPLSADIAALARESGMSEEEYRRYKTTSISDMMQ